MAVVVYKCSVCQRDIELPRNESGLEVVGRCTITHGCRGELYQVALYRDYKRGHLPAEVVGLDDWQQRRVLYDHTQAIENTNWIIQHNLGTMPSVSVFVNRPIEGDEDNLEEITPTDVRIIGPDVLELVFDRAWSGIAQLVARQSDPHLFDTVQVTTETVSTPVQTSSAGEITIATKLVDGVEPPTINLQVEYQTTAGGTQTVTYTADDQPSVDSPWRDVDKVIISGRVYVVRSFSGLVPDMTTGVIGNGSTFYFTGVDSDADQIFQPIEPREIVMLLATSPYDIVDKIYTEVIDVTVADPVDNPFAFYYDSGEFFALEDTSTSVFPPIRSV